MWKYSPLEKAVCEGFHNILLDEVLGGIHRLTINCPKELNALNAGALEMDRAMDILVADPTARECC